MASNRQQRPPRGRPGGFLLETVAGGALLAAMAIVGVFFVHRPAENRLDAFGFSVLPDEPNNRIWHLLADVGTVRVVLATILVAVALTLWRDWRRSLACVIGPLAALGLTEEIAKPLASRNVYPFGAHSFPSGTVTAAAAVATVGVLALPRALRALGALAAGALIVCVSAAVIALRWHFATDTLGGACVGTGAVLVLDGALHLVRRRRRGAHSAVGSSSSSTASREPYSASY